MEDIKLIEKKKGSIVTIYEDPLTQTKPEGKAKLVRYVSDDVMFTTEYAIEYWDVQFEGEKRKVLRKIIVDKKTRMPFSGDGNA